MSLYNNTHNRFVVVTPNLNMGVYLAETIESILINLRSGDEYYIIDGGSSDESIDIIKKYSNKISGWVSEKDNGYADAINKGFALGTGAYQCWVNSGDLLLKDSLDFARKLLDNTSVDMIFGDDLYIDHNSRIIQVSNGHMSNLKLAMLNGGWTPLQDACFWRSSLYERIGGLDINLKNAADYDLFLRMSVLGKTQYSPHIYSAFRRHAGQKSIKNMSEYRRERDKSRLRELKRVYSGMLLFQCLISSYYWIKIRWHVRVRQKKFSTFSLKGRLASEV